MPRFAKKMRLIKWQHDINSYYRWKAFYERLSDEGKRGPAGQRALEFMQEVKDRWPEYADRFE